MIRLIPFLIFCMIALNGCTAFRVSPPDYDPARLQKASQRSDFLIETVDLIDRANPIGNVGNRIWGGQYRVLLTDSLHDYFEAEVVQSLERNGFDCAEFPGASKARRLGGNASGAPPLYLRLELQDLTLSRHPQSHLTADQVYGVCKIRGVLFDLNGEMLFQRQFVGKVDTYRPSDELVPPGVGFISRPGLSLLLTKLLESTVEDFREEGVPEMTIIREEYRDAFVTAVDAPVRSVPAEPAATDDDEEEEPWVW